MPNTKWEPARKAWKILRQWKIQAHRRRRRPFAVDLRHLRRFINRLTHPSGDLRPHYTEQQFSFHDTPIFHLKLHRLPSSSAAASRFDFPCINPKVEFDYEFESRAVDDDDEGDRRRLGGYGGACDFKEDEEEGIDVRAEKFIKMFYEEMKMQNQVPYLPYDEFSDSHE